MKRILVLALILIGGGLAYEQYTGNEIGFGTTLNLTYGAISGGFAGGYGMATGAGQSIGGAVGGMGQGVSNSMGGVFGK